MRKSVTNVTHVTQEYGLYLKPGVSFWFLPTAQKPLRS